MEIQIIILRFVVVMAINLLTIVVVSYWRWAHVFPNISARVKKKTQRLVASDLHDSDLSESAELDILKMSMDEENKSVSIFTIVVVFGGLIVTLLLGLLVVVWLYVNGNFIQQNLPLQLLWGFFFCNIVQSPHASEKHQRLLHHRAY